MNKYLILVVSLVLFYSCSNDDNVDDPTETDPDYKLSSASFYVDEGFYQKDTLVYGQNGLISKIANQVYFTLPQLYQFEFDDSLLSKVYWKYNIPRDTDLDEIISFTINSEDNLQYSCSYDGDKLIEMITPERDLISNGVTHRAISKMSFNYTDDQITLINFSMNIDDQGFETFNEFRLVYTGNNITTINEQRQGVNGELIEDVYEYTYHDGKNPFNDLFKNNSIFYFPDKLFAFYNSFDAKLFANCLSENIVKTEQFNNARIENFSTTYNDDLLITWDSEDDYPASNYTYVE